MMDWYDHNMGWWGYAGMGIGTALLGLLIIGGIVAMVIFVVRETDPAANPFTSQAPTEALAMRFARGEINETEYRDRLAVLHESTRV